MATLEELSLTFDTRLECMSTLVDLQYASEEVDCNRHFENLFNEVEKLENVVVMMKSLIEKQKEQSKQVQELKSVFQNLIDHLQYSCVNVPAHIPLPVKQETTLQENTSKSNIQTSNGSASTGKCTTKNKPMEKKDNIKTGKKSGKQDVYMPTFEYVTVDEFEAVPKYMKGRLTYSQLNAAIDELNKPFQEKYKILSLKRTTLSDVNRKRFENYKLQETKDTAGEYFIVESDIKEFSNLKMDSVGRSILTVLRHCGRMKEIRGSGHTRYAYLPVY